MSGENNQVLVVECKDYNIELIKEKISAALKPLGGIESFVQENQTVLLKPNLLMAKKPEAGITTHPAVVQAIAELVGELGAEVIIADSPGGPFNKTVMKRVYQKTGMSQVAQVTTANLNWNFASQTKDSSDAKILNKLTVGQFIAEADVIINLPKFKTHGLTKMTGGVKNMFGAVPGLLKAEYHMKMPQIDNFSDALLDVALATKTSLTIVDGITAMEGEGPSSGDKFQLNRLVIGVNPLAVDVAMADIVGIKPQAVATIAAAERRGLTHNIDQIEYLGIETKLTEFKTPTIDSSAQLLDRRMPSFLARWIRKLVKPKPVFNDQRCIQCGACITGCPPQVISKTEEGVEADLEGCIRCFCCQELCPEDAVDIHRPLLGKLLFGE
ncbi:DUF362 domain-containing protein [Halanaerobacter jeridensis]|uniref:Ferredoxin n=1 Tax=Halanaerobacter jeridensis TaxID=706427 RepID=A0A938XUE3_9FIRM|nr:DUF362 domain-containing protein [Halanaerobacter jeridensis]MBM7555435.1 uncharacterized protein (DUF362 family)/Pyruvate/2-oxoacid:ferredoxin oxidoreductase delta subunit [Halanaerobacter jeridensis]